MKSFKQFISEVKKKNFDERITNSKVTLHRKVQKELSALPSEIVNKAIDIINELPNNPYPDGVKKHQGKTSRTSPVTETEYSYRITKGYRVIYDVKPNNEIFIKRVAARKESFGSGVGGRRN